MDGPVLLEPLHGQPLEQLAPPLEVVAQRGEHQRLAEPTRPAQEVVAAGGDQAVEHLGLVDIDQVLCANLGEVLFAHGVSQFSHDASS